MTAMGMMIDSGPSMDPVTRTPRARKRDLDREIKQAAEEQGLRGQAKSLNIVSSDEGRTLLAMIEGRLEQRLDALIDADPEASAYKKIIIEMGHTQRLARQAIEKLYQRHLERNEGD